MTSGPVIAVVRHSLFFQLNPHLKEEEKGDGDDASLSLDPLILSGWKFVRSQKALSSNTNSQTAWMIVMQAD